MKNRPIFSAVLAMLVVLGASAELIAGDAIDPKTEQLLKQALGGMEPRDVAFLPDRIELTTTMPKPGDPRCCPAGTARWSIDRASLEGTRLR